MIKFITIVGHLAVQNQFRIHLSISISTYETHGHLINQAYLLM